MTPDLSLPDPRLMQKLSAPGIAESQVSRRALSDLLTQSSAIKLALVCAPAGFGKTTLLAQTLARFRDHGTATAWLTLDASDNDSSRFRRGLVAAVDRLLGTGAATADSQIDVVERLAGCSKPFALFLDDFDVIKDGSVLALVGEIVDSLPDGGRLILGSRRKPALGLARWRAKGMLVEVDVDHLRFSFEETVEYLNGRRQLALGGVELDRLHTKTEGWVTALWLASLALSRRQSPGEFIEAFSGSTDVLADYLARDVLDRQPEAVRTFLLRSSVVRDFSSSLCEALNPGCSSREILGELSADNLFLHPVVDVGLNYRFHPLFAEFLRGQLKQQMPELLPELHTAASSWYESSSRPVPAIDHALEAGDVDRAIRLLSLHAETLLEQGRMRLLAQWFAVLPVDRIAEHPMLQITQVWALCFTAGPREAMRLLEKCTAAGYRDPEVARRALILSPILLSMMDRIAEACVAGKDCLATLPEGNGFARTFLVNLMAHNFAVTRDYAKAYALLEAAKRSQGERFDSFNVMVSECLEGVLAMRQGRMREAVTRFRLGARGSRNSSSLGATPCNAWAGVLYAAALYEIGDSDQAGSRMQSHLPLVRSVALADQAIICYSVLCRIAIDRGEFDQAFELLGQLESLGHRRQLPRVVASARLERARWLLNQGQAEAAVGELDRAETPGLWEALSEHHMLANDIEDLALGRMRWMANEGRAIDACSVLLTEINLLLDSSRRSRLMKLRLLQAVALDRSGEPNRALDVLEKVLIEAHAAEFFRMVVDEGANLGALIQRLVDARCASACQDDLPFANYLHRVVGAYALDTKFRKSPAHSTLRHLPYEPLTPKEIRVIQLVSEGLSNDDIAEKLYVSRSTVKTHLRNVNTKLDAKSRTQAQAIARQLGLT